MPCTAAVTEPNRALSSPPTNGEQFVDVVTIRDFERVTVVRVPQRGKVDVFAPESARVVRVAGPAAHLLRVAALVSACGRQMFASRCWPRLLRRAPHQATLLARCLTEAACLRTARRLTGHGAVAVVVLSASEALHGGRPRRSAAPAVRPRAGHHPGRGRAAARPSRSPRREAGGGAIPDRRGPRPVGSDLSPLPGVVRPFAVDDGARFTRVWARSPVWWWTPLGTASPWLSPTTT